RVAEVVEAFASETPADVGVDGCGAPVFALSLNGLARAIGRVVSAGSSAEVGPPGDGAGAPADAWTDYTEQTRTLMDAVFADPWAIEGHGRPNTTVIERLGVFAKGGAEGVIVMATKSGYSVAVKCLDGSSRATGLVALTLLQRAGAFDAGANPASAPEVTDDDVAAVIAAIADPVTGGTDSEGRTSVVGRLALGEDIASIGKRERHGWRFAEGSIPTRDAAHWRCGRRSRSSTRARPTVRLWPPPCDSRSRSSRLAPKATASRSVFPRSGSRSASPGPATPAAPRRTSSRPPPRCGWAWSPGARTSPPRSRPAAARPRAPGPTSASTSPSSAPRKQRNGDERADHPDDVLHRRAACALPHHLCERRPGHRRPPLRRLPGRSR